MAPERFFWLFIICHIALWTITATVGGSPGGVHHDMSEAWAWGQEFQIGYFKHPPLPAWITALWFEIFPRSDWAFYFLAAINSAVGLVGVWFLAGLFFRRWTQFSAVLFLAFTPFYGIMAANFNSNAILLSLWPWTTYFFVRSLKSGSTIDGVLFGAMAGLALMAKYTSALLLLTCIVASFLRAGTQRYYRSYAPYIAVVVCTAIFAPHVWWVFTQDLSTLKYATRWSGTSYSVLLYHTFITALACVAMHAIPLGAFILAYRSRALSLLRRVGSRLVERRNVWHAVMVGGPFLLTLLAGVMGQTKISTRFMIPVFFYLPIAFLIVGQIEFNEVRIRPLIRLAAILAIIALLIAPIIALFPQSPARESKAFRDLGGEATRLWHEAFDRPLRIVSAVAPYQSAIAFYSPDWPSVFTNLSFNEAPWISPERIRQDGLLIVCEQNVAPCLHLAERFLIPGTRHFTVTPKPPVFDDQGRPMIFEIWAVPPADLVPAQ